MASIRHDRQSYAARLNAFRAAGPDGCRTGIEAMIAAAGRVGGLTSADLNFPEHLAGENVDAISRALSDHGLALNGLAMRYAMPEFANGAFTNPDAAIRREAIDLTRRGLDILAEMGGSLMTLWMGQDGFDYAFQADYGVLWDRTVSALVEVADHNPDINVAVEYKPNEPRAFALMPDVATTLLGLCEADRPNLGITLDFAHSLYADEMPAHAACLVARHSRLLGVHLNDGYGKRDDGLMAGVVHPIQTVELFVVLAGIGYDGVIYFDTFPDHSGLDPVEECRTNLANTERLRMLAARLSDHVELRKAIARQDAATSQRIVARALFGAG
ncbi:MAG: sugar phosphate isomerase/epimerase [Paracoccaceae bacterium]|nr:sugar phosphate isomerase/epimerase [Paracoccaceae bacterium]